MTRFISIGYRWINSDLVGEVREVRGDCGEAYDREGRHLGTLSETEMEKFRNIFSDQPCVVPVPEGWKLMRIFEEGGSLTEIIIGFDVKHGWSRAITASTIVEVGPNAVVLRPDGTVLCGEDMGDFKSIEEWRAYRKESDEKHRQWKIAQGKA